MRRSSNRCSNPLVSKIWPCPVSRQHFQHISKDLYMPRSIIYRLAGRRGVELWMKIKYALLMLIISYILITMSVATAVKNADNEAVPEPSVEACTAAAPEPSIDACAAEWVPALELSTNATATEPIVKEAPKYEPKIYFIPKILSFLKSDWEGQGKRIKIAVYNPLNCHIIHASIKPGIPVSWDFIPDTNNNLVNFDPEKSLFWVHGVGNFKHNYTESWFEIKPGPHTSEGIYEMYINSSVFFNNIHSNINFSKNFSTLVVLEVIPKDPIPKPDSNIFKENAWIFVILSSLCALAGIIIKLKSLLKN